jgi:hypothetical protein
MNDEQATGGGNVPGVIRPPGDFSDITMRPAATLTPASTVHAKPGTILRVKIFAESWDSPGTIETLDYGAFEICGMRIDGPPSIATIEAISTSLQSPIRREAHSQGWESATLSQIAGEIAGRAGLSLVYELDADPEYPRTDQRRESDMTFLSRLAKDQGAAVKVMDNQLIVYSEEKYEAKPAVMTIRKGDGRLEKYAFWQDTSDTAASATVTFKDPDSGKQVTATFPDEGDEINVPAVENRVLICTRPPGINPILQAMMYA